MEEDEFVSRILEEDEYFRIEPKAVIAGDVAVYKNRYGEIEHTGVAVHCPHPSLSLTHIGSVSISARAREAPGVILNQRGNAIPLKEASALRRADIFDNTVLPRDIASTEEDADIWVVSKWGDGGEYVHLAKECPFGEGGVLWMREGRDDHRVYPDDVSQGAGDDEQRNSYD